LLSSDVHAQSEEIQTDRSINHLRSKTLTKRTTALGGSATGPEDDELVCQPGRCGQEEGNARVTSGWLLDARIVSQLTHASVTHSSLDPWSTGSLAR
jgi:hypothetical protein